MVFQVNKLRLSKGRSVKIKEAGKAIHIKGPFEYK